MQTSEKFCCVVNGLTLHFPIPIFNNPEKEAL